MWAPLSVVFNAKKGLAEQMFCAKLSHFIEYQVHILKMQ